MSAWGPAAGYAALASVWGPQQGKPGHDFGMIDSYGHAIDEFIGWSELSAR
jgi:hypothetical protein